MAQTFQDFIKTERERLTAKREEIRKQHRELENQLAEIHREFLAIDAYEAAKSGKPKRASGASRATGPRRSSKRDSIIAVLKANPTGLSRGEILEQMGLRGDKSGEMSVSNALTALTKANQVVRRDGKYVAAGG